MTKSSANRIRALVCVLTFYSNRSDHSVPLKQATKAEGASALCSAVGAMRLDDG